MTSNIIEIVDQHLYGVQLVGTLMRLRPQGLGERPDGVEFTGRASISVRSRSVATVP